VEYQEHIGAPLPEALDGRNPRDDLLIGQIMQDIQLELSVVDAMGEISQVADLLP
jgi:hypothetical protein